MDKYFIYDPAENEFETFETEAEQEEYAAKRIESYKGDEWDEAVEDIVCGIITKVTKQININNRPAQLVDGYDKHGFCWPDGITSICDYDIVEI